jgi:LuxR family maltose regulon positive regulatory protein
MKRPQLAKLTRPRLHKAVPREKLLELLDERREYPAVWIVGPPGAGKTTLAASYLEESGVPAIWYQIDPGDSDPASFFYYLKQAVEQAGLRKSKPLALLTPEYLPDLPGFARRFLREMFLQLPDDIIIVLDNYHDIAATSALHAALAAALAEIPLGANFIVLSRADAPPAYAASLVGKTISVVTWDELRLAPEETERLAAAVGVTDPHIVQRLHQQAGGWIAGLTLMLERLHRGGSLDKLDGEDVDTVFEYFAGLMFDHTSAETREILMKTAFLPQVSAQYAEAVTGKMNAIQHLEELHRRHLFTDRSFAQDVLYQYHALFRAFLKNRAARAYSLEERRDIARRAAAALVAGGRSEEAVLLYAEAEDWDAAERLIIDCAAILLRQGRWQTFQEQVKLLPLQRIGSSPWVLYWLGRSKTFVEPVAALPALEAAYRIFRDSHNEVGQLLATAAMLEAIYVHYRNFTLMDPWITRAVNLLEREVPLPTPEDELWVHSMLLVGASYRNPEHPMVSKSISRVEELLACRFDPNLMVSVASVLHSYGYSTIDVAAEQLAISTARPLLSDPDLTAGRASFYLAQEGYTHYVHGRHEKAFSCFDEADAVATQHGLDNVALTNTVWRALTQRRAGMLKEAEESIRRAEAFAGANKLPFAPMEFVKACVEYERGNHRSAVIRLMEAQSICEISGSHISKMLIRLVSANILIDCGEFDMAADLLKRAKDEILGPVTEHYLGAILLNEAWLAHRQGHLEKRGNCLREALRRSTDMRTRERFRWYAKAMSELFPVALENGIEPQITVDLAREFGIVPSAIEVEAWPWPIRIYTLGRFELLLDDKPPEFSRKTPKKVLALLKAIIAHGTKDVPEERIVDALWPDEEGDAARRSLSATLHRLRNVLGDGKVVRQSGGQLTLDERSCWMDMRAFESRIERSRGDPNELEKAIALYRGVFLPQEVGVPWIVPTRERLRSKFIHAVGKLGSVLEASNQYEAAIDLYLRGIEADNIVEPFYQGLMRCYARLDRRTEAMNAYRRLRELLSLTLGVAPSSATQRLFAALRPD